ncbi:SIMPL domain-containing protein [Massilia solisilvae]|uniref:SIMPL domain-containing protein n=1 Tax=Massilia solisilvae TaxID=1811225 RepID=A0ABT2BH71_9BURK|nr:SIMPL domain-containing protein [Massilia solisilvae]MCS0607805.1 SIMPL domain-containing protein [Massilia solisilvae]
MLKKVLALTTLLLAPLAVPASQLPDYPFIHITGTAQQYVQPDMGSIDFEVIAADADPAVALRAVQERVAEVRALVQAQGLEAESLEVRNVRQELRKNQRADGPAVVEVKCVVHLDVHDLAKWATLANGLLGMQNLDSFATAFDTSEREKIEAGLAADAVRDASRKAGALAAGLGRKLGPVTGLSTGALRNLGNAMGLVAADFGFRRKEAPQTQGSGRDNLVNVVMVPMALSVDAIFRLK